MRPGPTGWCSCGTVSSWTPRARWTNRTRCSPLRVARREGLADRPANRPPRGEPGDQPLRYTPHDFRRLFVTDAILNGLPPHIAQVICGHLDLATTMTYKATYPTETIEHHRAFIARRRATRPSQE